MIAHYVGSAIWSLAVKTMINPIGSNIVLALAVCVFASQATLSQAAPAGLTPETPGISFKQARALGRLVRSSMAEYIKNRTSADNQNIPADVAKLGGKDWSAAITLRDRGQAIATVIRSGRSCPRNVIAAALVAMRSSALPDRVTPEVLSKLTVEIEILGSELAVSENKAPESVITGMVGLKLTRGLQKSYATPAQTYLLDPTGPEAKRQCLTGINFRGNIKSMPNQWEIFYTRHIISYPDGKDIVLYRGKLLPLPGSITERVLNESALAIGAYLSNMQETSGRYTCASGPANLSDHLQATWAMAQLAKQSNNNAITQSLQHALTYAGKSISRSKDRAIVVHERFNDRLAATALMRLVIDLLPADNREENLPDDLARGLLADMNTLKSEDITVATYSLRKGIYLALMTLANDKILNDKDRERLGRIQSALGQNAKAPADDEEMMWAVRAGVWDILPIERKLGFISDSERLDEAGAFASKSKSISTVASALAVVNLSEGKTWPGEDGKGKAWKILAGKRFCHMMLFKKIEIYFDGKPEKWINGVRASPGSAKITMSSCATALQAMLCK